MPAVPTTVRGRGARANRPNPPRPTGHPLRRIRPAEGRTLDCGSPGTTRRTGRGPGRRVPRLRRRTRPPITDLDAEDRARVALPPRPGATAPGQALPGQHPL